MAHPRPAERHYEPVAVRVIPDAAHELHVGAAPCERQGDLRSEASRGQIPGGLGTVGQRATEHGDHGAPKPSSRMTSISA
jgi:hypothetical protein